MNTTTETVDYEVEVVTEFTPKWGRLTWDEQEDDTA